MFQDSTVVADSVEVVTRIATGWYGVAAVALVIAAGVYFALRGTRKSSSSKFGSQTGGGSDSGSDSERGPGQQY